MGKDTHVEASDGGEGGVVRTPVGHDVALEADLALEDLVDRSVVLASIGVVDQV